MLVPMRFALALLFLPLTCLAQASSPWQMEPSETTADLRGIHAVGGGVVWASGAGGTVLRSQDSGFEWQQCAIPPGAEKLDFRAIWAWDDQTAIVMSSGQGALSRLYKTVDGCAHWTLLYTNPDKDGFWDAMVFRTQASGAILGDPVGGQFVMLETNDGGHTWTHNSIEGLDAAPGLGAFAASNSALLLSGPYPAVFGTSGAKVYIERYSYKPVSWSPWSEAVKTIGPWQSLSIPVASHGQAAGIFSLGYHTDGIGDGTILAVGGDYAKPDERAGTAALSEDGGIHWTAATKPPGGYRSAVAWDANDKIWITVGPNGSDISRDNGRTWQPMEHAPANAPKGGEWNALSLPWAVGPHGRIGKLNLDATTLAR